MKKLIVTLALLVLALNLRAADAGWETDVSGAINKAKAGKRPLLINFTGSDWCQPCIYLHKTVFMSAEFKQWAKARNVVLVEIDFPRRERQSAEVKAANQKYRRYFRAGGFPTVLLFNSAGKERFRQTGLRPMSAKEYIASLEAKLR